MKEALDQDIHKANAATKTMAKTKAKAKANK